MYYEEQIIDGLLRCRSTPDGEWRIAAMPHATSVNALCQLNDDQRREVFGYFCSHCGCVQPTGRICQCWNDE